MTEKQTSPLIDRETWQADIAQRQGIGEVAMSNLVEPLSIENVPEEQRAFDALTILITDRVWIDVDDLTTIYDQYDSAAE